MSSVRKQTSARSSWSERHADVLPPPSQSDGESSSNPPESRAVSAHQFQLSSDKFSVTSESWKSTSLTLNLLL